MEIHRAKKEPASAWRLALMSLGYAARYDKPTQTGGLALLGLVGLKKRLSGVRSS